MPSQAVDREVGLKDVPCSPVRVPTARLAQRHLTVVRLLLHVMAALLLTLRGAQLGETLHPMHRALANDWVRLLFYVDAQQQVAGETEIVTLPHFLLEPQEQIAANVDDEFFGGGFAARASAMPVGALFTIDETRAHVHGAVSNYLRLADVALDEYVVAGNGTELPPPLLTVRTDFGEDPVDTHYNITNATASEQWPPALRTGKDSASQIETRKFFDELDAMELSVVVGMKRKQSRQLDGETQVLEERLSHWRIVMRYDLLNQGHLEVTINYQLVHVPVIEGERTGEEDMPPVFFDTSTMLSWATLLVIGSYQAVEFWLKWMSVKAVAAQHPTTLRFFARHPVALAMSKGAAKDFWFWFILAVNVVTAGCLLATWCHAYRLVMDDALCFVFALCCALQWGSLVRYLQVNTRFHILGLTLRRGLPRVIQFLVGVFPIFVGFVLFGTVMFGAKVPRFQSASATATTLFSVANGDEIHDTFSDVAYTPWIGQIYVYSYLILFSYVVLMVCIGIIEDAFFSAVFPASWPTHDKPQDDAPTLGHRHSHQDGH